MSLTDWLMLYSISVMTNVMVFSIIAMAFLFFSADDLFEFAGTGDDFFKRFFYMVVPVANVFFVFRMIYNAVQAFIRVRKKKKSLAKFLNSMIASRKNAKELALAKTPLSDDEYKARRRIILASSQPGHQYQYTCDCGASNTLQGAQAFSKCRLCETFVQNEL